jgi:hypothetical protein
MPYRVTIRTGGKVERHARDSLAEAVDLLQTLAARAPRLAAVDLRARRWGPGDQVAARVEVSGPERWRPVTRAGVDVRGDGSAEAWTGGRERSGVDPQPGEDAYAALRRVLGLTG